MERLLRDIEPGRGGREDRADEDGDRPEPVGLEFIARAGVEHEVAQPREKMLEQGPGQTHQHHLAPDVGNLVKGAGVGIVPDARSEEHTSELQSLMRTSYAVFCLKKNTHNNLTNKLKT